MDGDVNQYALVSAMESEFTDESACENYSQSDVEDTLTEQGHFESGSRSSLYEIHDELNPKSKSGTDDSDTTIREATSPPRPLTGEPVTSPPGPWTGEPSTPTESVATESALYETPFTSVSGFDVYLTAFEESSHSLDKVLKFNNLTEIPAAASNFKPLKDSMSMRESELFQSQKAQPRGGKGGERLGSTGKCTPKKTMPSPPKSLPVTGREGEKTPSEKSKNSNGSLKSGSFRAISKGIKGGTKALLIQKVSCRCCVLDLLMLCYR
jgi:hypothetical protein